jgi:hypothetical protein
MEFLVLSFEFLVLNYGSAKKRIPDPPIKNYELRTPEPCALRLSYFHRSYFLLARSVCAFEIHNSPPQRKQMAILACIG